MCSLNSMSKAKNNMKDSSNTQMVGSRTSAESYKSTERSTRAPVERVPITGGRPPARPAIENTK